MSDQPAPHFELPATSGKTFNPAQYAAEKWCCILPKD